MAVKYVLDPAYVNPDFIIKKSDGAKTKTTTDINKGRYSQSFFEGLVGIKHYETAKADRKITVKNSQNWYHLADLPDTIDVLKNIFYIVGSKKEIVTALADDLATRPQLIFEMRVGYCPKIAVHKHTLFNSAVAAITFRNGDPKQPWDKDYGAGKYFRWWSMSPKDVGAVASANGFSVHPGQFAAKFNTLMSTMMGY